MTAVVGVVHDGAVHLGADSAGASGYDLTVRADAKAFKLGPYVIGFTTSFRMGQILRYAFSPPEPSTKNLERFMVTEFVDAARKALKDAGWATKDNEREIGGDWLVGVAGRLFRVCGDYQVGESVDGYNAVGCGDQVARGALHATPRMQPRQRLRTALEAAERHSAGVRGPFTFVRSR